MSAAGTSAEQLDRALESLRERLPSPDPSSAHEVRVTFWTYSPHGPQPSWRMIAVPGWDEIGRLRRADARGPRGADGRVRARSRWAARALAGKPGTGKTFALRALAWEWRSWCSLHYIVDPDSFFGEHADYLMNVLMMPDELEHHPAAFHPYLGSVAVEADDESPKPKPWRLLVLRGDGFGELLTPDAKTVIGQGLSRFLNLVDGLIGQGLRVLVLVTTNEPIPPAPPRGRTPGSLRGQCRVRPSERGRGSALARRSRPGRGTGDAGDFGLALRADRRAGDGRGRADGGLRRRGERRRRLGLRPCRRRLASRGHAAHDGAARGDDRDREGHGPRRFRHGVARGGVPVVAQARDGGSLVHGRVGADGARTDRLHDRVGVKSPRSPDIRCRWRWTPASSRRRPAPVTLPARVRDLKIFLNNARMQTRSARADARRGRDHAWRPLGAGVQLCGGDVERRRPRAQGQGGGAEGGCRLYVAATAPKMQALAGEIGDGCLTPSITTPAFVRYTRDNVAADIDIGCTVIASIDESDRGRGRDGAREIGAMYLANKFQNIPPARPTPCSSSPESRWLSFAPVAEAMERGGRLTAEAQVSDDVLDRCKPIAGTPGDCIEAIEEYRRGRLHARDARAVGRPPPRPAATVRRARASPGFRT